MAQKIQEWRNTTALQRKNQLIDDYGGECIKCGAEENLHFHHRESEHKRWNIGERWAHASIESLYEEADKCDLLCEACHVKYHIENTRPKAEHGTRSKYNSGCKCPECKRANTLYEYNRRTGRG